MSTRLSAQCSSCSRVHYTYIYIILYLRRLTYRGASLALLAWRACLLEVLLVKLIFKRSKLTQQSITSLNVNLLFFLSRFRLLSRCRCKPRHVKITNLNSSNQNILIQQEEHPKRAKQLEIRTPKQSKHHECSSKQRNPCTSSHQSVSVSKVSVNVTRTKTIRHLRCNNYDNNCNFNIFIEDDYFGCRNCYQHGSCVMK